MDENNYHKVVIRMGSNDVYADLNCEAPHDAECRYMWDCPKSDNEHWNCSCDGAFATYPGGPCNYLLSIERSTPAETYVGPDKEFTLGSVVFVRNQDGYGWGMSDE